MKCDIRTCKRVTYDTIRSVLIGTLTGLAITFFANTVSFLGNLNEQYPALLLLLPFASCITLKIYQKLGDAYRRITVEAIDIIHESEDEILNPKRKVSPWMGVVAYIAAALSHLSGASVGKEGAGVHRRHLSLCKAHSQHRAEGKPCGEEDRHHRKRRTPGGGGDHGLVRDACRRDRIGRRGGAFFSERRGKTVRCIADDI